MTHFRISTFNCENLFSRPKVLNYADNERGRAPLNALAKFNGLLSKEKYSAADKRKIFAYLEQLRAFIDLNEMRQKLIGKKKVRGVLRPTISVDGRSDWVGGITLKRDPLPTAAQKNTAKVIQAVDADVQCVVEVEDRVTLEQFSQSLLKGNRDYPYNLLLDGNDPRGIDVGLLSRFPIASVKTHIFDKPSKASTSRIFSRDCLEVQLTLPSGRPLFVLLNHFKSQGYGSKASNDARRKLQADHVVKLLGSYNLKRDLVVVLGDFNDRPQSAPLARLLRLNDLSDVIANRYPNPKDRWTYRDQSQTDYLLASKPLTDALRAAGIERRGLFAADKLTKNLPSGQVRPFDSVSATTNGASDHAAVWAEFRI